MTTGTARATIGSRPQPVPRATSAAKSIAVARTRTMAARLPRGVAAAPSPVPHPRPAARAPGATLPARTSPAVTSTAPRCARSTAAIRTFDQADLQGAVLSDACLQGASFRGADLRGSTWGGACLIDADFTGAALGETTTFADAIVCGTILPDGTIDNRDCARCPAAASESSARRGMHVRPPIASAMPIPARTDVCTCGGAPACTAPTAACCDCCGPNPNGVCVDLETDPLNCGACDNVCPRGGACTVPVCVAGQCGLAQAPDNTNPNAACPFPAVACCGGTCTDIFNDPNHCGTCGTQCFSQTCAITGCADGDCYFHGYAPLGQPGPGCATGQCCV